MPNMYYEARFKLGGKQSDEFEIVASDAPETIVIQ